uniref:pathogenesis-related leaf protein 4-like n=1 Tax=Erigeron canadensis TaxID=72917 RepID=UPI001CB8B62E|nr:pathogenesis-related leaf protein 4-like [Erigeron canadensis]
MRSLKISFALVCFLILAILRTPHAQNSPQDYLDTHNSARANVGVKNMIWNTSVAAYAQNYANQRILDCNLVHSNGPFGENLAKGDGTFTGTAAVNLWIDEKYYYDHMTNTCVGGHACGHYTQVVWRDSFQLGCARVQCISGWSFVICSYYPSGNYIGETPY